MKFKRIKFNPRPTKSLLLYTSHLLLSAVAAVDPLLLPPVVPEPLDANPAPAVVVVEEMLLLRPPPPAAPETPPALALLLLLLVGAW